MVIKAFRNRRTHLREYGVGLILKVGKHCDNVRCATFAIGVLEYTSFSDGLSYRHEAEAEGEGKEGENSREDHCRWV